MYSFNVVVYERWNSFESSIMVKLWNLTSSKSEWYIYSFDVKRHLDNMSFRGVATGAADEFLPQWENVADTAQYAQDGSFGKILCMREATTYEAGNPANS